MRTITAGKLRARLGEMLDLASAGERIAVERDHRLIAVIVPPEDGQQLEGKSKEAIQRRIAALDRIEARAKRMKELRPRDPDDPWDAATAIRWERDHGHDQGE
jgi:antitoxin (DNA-binding transcriptional repressor) of toxin-antitoxin stability system